MKKCILLVKLFLSALFLYSQQGAISDEVIPFSDFHIHTTFKNYYRFVEHPDSVILHENDPDFINRKYGKTAWTAFNRKNKHRLKAKESNMANYDQADFANLTGLKGSILCTSITPPEKLMLSSKTDRWLNRHFVTKMSMQRQKELANSNNSSFKEFYGEYLYAVNQDSVVHDARILVARNNQDLRRINREGGIALVLTMEGGHVLFGEEISAKTQDLKSAGCDTPCRAEIFSNIDKIRNLPHQVFFITVAHFGWNKMFGHSKSIDKPGIRRDLLTTATLSDEFKKAIFAKYGDGIIGPVRSYDLLDTVILINGTRRKITLPYSADEYVSDLGYQVMYKLLDQENDFKDPIYIDCKHMDLKARFQYYEFIDSVNQQRKKAGKKTIPIIASHIGLSGKKRPVAFATAQYPLSNSYEELIFGPTFYKVQLNDHDQFWRNYISLLKPDDRRIYFDKNDPAGLASFNPFEGNVNYNTLGWFYPWEINFCDEEIKYIYDSEGIIGLNLDRRILGFDMPQYNRRYKRFLRRKFVNINGKNHYGMPDGTAINFDDYYASEPLLRNIFHIIEVSGKSDSTSWDHIAIGSDYDGFIQPISLSATAEDIPSFHKKMEVFTDLFIKIHNKQKLMYGLSAKTAMQKFFFTNGKDFILKNFQE